MSSRAVRWIIVALCFVGWALLSPTFAQQAAIGRPANWHDVMPHADEQRRLADGIPAADVYRRSLLAPLPGEGRPRAVHLAAALELLQRRATQLLPKRHRPTPSPAFAVDTDFLLSRIRGSSLSMSATGFASFAGKWFGVWDGNLVDHDWSPVVVCEPPLLLHDRRPITMVQGLQYAWVGDGFGWNLLCHQADTPAAQFMLGSVCQVHGRDRRQIVSQRPLVGIAVDDDKLIWIAPEGVYMEEVRTSESAEQTYIITGCHCGVTDEKWQQPSQGFQSIYTRDPANRPAWISFSLTSEGPEWEVSRHRSRTE